MDIFDKIVEDAQITNLANIIALFFNTLVKAGVPGEFASEMTCALMYASSQKELD